MHSCWIGVAELEARTGNRPTGAAPPSLQTKASTKAVTKRLGQAPEFEAGTLAEVYNKLLQVSLSPKDKPTPSITCQ